MGRPSSATVNDLVDAMLEGAEMVPEYSAAELTSASFTLTLRVMKTLFQMSPDQKPVVRQAVEMLLMECAHGRGN